VTLRLAVPGIFLAGLLLLPFLSKPYTIDDPLFLREAAHALADPLHPADFEQVWNAGDRQKLSQFLLGGTLPAYVLAPVAALGGRECFGHAGARNPGGGVCLPAPRRHPGGRSRPARGHPL